MAPAPSPGPRELRRLLCDGRPQGTLVAFGAAGDATFLELRTRVASLAARLRRGGPGRFVLLCRDPFAFGVGLFGLAHAGCTAVLPPNAQPGTLRAVAAGASGVISDRRLDLRELEHIDPLGRTLESDAPLAPLERDAPLCELFTSGTTGSAKSIPKALRHFDDEAAALEAEFGAALGDARVFSTVSFLHLYGLTFRVLWPLAAGRAFSRDTPLHPGELCAALSRGDAFALVTTPLHLRHLVRRTAELARLRAGHRLTFASAGPLDRATALTTAEALGEAPIEIYGSTETGAVAARRRSAADPEPAYRPLRFVRLERDPGSGRLLVRSPFVSVGTGAPGALGLLTGDRVEPLASGLRLLGRVDRVVKIGEKRLALPEMEEALAASPLVEEAALCTYSRGSATRVGAVVVASERGRAELAAGGRVALVRALREALAQGFDAPLVPRAWRFPPALPRDAQGKVAHGELAALFARAPARVRRPILLQERRLGDRLERRLRIPHELAALRGHFPGFPLVPGVAQLGFVLDAAAALLGSAQGASEIEVVKFRHPLRPGDEFELAIERDPRTGRLRFELRDEDRVFSDGRMRVRGEP
jgi:acyl-coenzyme A synthetase/AMP-(fatty) acid ligase